MTWESTPSGCCHNGPVTRSKTASIDRSKNGADFLQLDLREAPQGRLSAWISKQLRSAIVDGRLPIGSKLPATRVLAAELQVSRGVVTEAYQRLIEDGHLAGRGRAGTIVVAGPTAAPIASRIRRAGRPTTSEKNVFGGTPNVDVFDALRRAPAKIDLSPGLPDLTAFPRAAWLRAERAVFGSLEASDLGYGDPRGVPALRIAVTNWLARNRGIRVEPETIVIVGGVAQAFALIAQVLQADGITDIAVEDPGSLGARQQLQSWQVNTPPVAVDDLGIDVAALQSSGAPAVLVTPAHQFPIGVVLDGGRRRELAQWADADHWVVEDDYDAEHRYDRPPVPALRSMLPERVFYTGSVSKLLAPALRLGWLLAPPAYLDAVMRARRSADLGGAAIPQFVLARLMESGELERQLRLLRRRHRRRRDAMVAAVRTYLPGATVHGAAAGLHLTVTFDASWSDVDLAAAALHRGVKVHPLSWHRQRPGTPGLILGYAASPVSDITEGVATLSTVMRRLRRTRP